VAGENPTIIEIFSSPLPVFYLWSSDFSMASGGLTPALHRARKQIIVGDGA
jgi:hypothetical protein